MCAMKGLANVAKKNLLILGGNGFIGSEFVKQVLRERPETKITLLNRGRSWDWDKAEEIEDQVCHIRHDRRKPISTSPRVTSKLCHTHWNAVVDFSGFEPSMVEDSIKTLSKLTDKYVYISTDSVYEVSREKSHCGPSKEEDAIRPADPKEIARLAKMDEYGHEKLTCEETITSFLGGDQSSNSQKMSGMCKFIVLRLADVIGPRDGTDRFWQYLLWVYLAQETNTKVLLPEKYRNQKLSLVYVSDVCEIIMKILYEIDDSRLYNQAYNLACQETPKLDELISDIQEALGFKTPLINFWTYDDSEEIPEIFPSVERGPVDISKAKHELGWSPTCWKQVVQSTVAFYESVQKHESFVDEKKSVYKELKKDLASFYSTSQLRLLKKFLHLND